MQRIERIQDHKRSWVHALLRVRVVLVRVGVPVGAMLLFGLPFALFWYPHTGGETSVSMVFGVGTALGLFAAGVYLCVTTATRLRVPAVFVPMMISWGVVSGATILAPYAFDGVWSQSENTVLGGSFALACALALYAATPTLTMLYRAASVAGVSMVLTTVISALRYGTTGMLGFGAYESYMEAVAALIAVVGIVLMPGVRSLREYGSVLIVLSASMGFMTLTEAPVALWIGVACTGGVFAIRYIVSLVHHAVRPVSRHVGNLLQVSRMHMVQVALVLVTLYATAYTVLPIHRAVYQGGDVATYADTYRILRTHTFMDPLSIPGYAGFPDIWRRAGLVTSVPADAPVRGVSTFLTEVVEGGCVAMLALGTCFMVILGMGLRIRYGVRRYDRGWYRMAHAAWAGAIFMFYAGTVMDIGIIGRVVWLICIALVCIAYEVGVGSRDIFVYTVRIHRTLRTGGFVLAVSGLVLAMSTFHYVRASSEYIAVRSTDALMKQMRAYREHIREYTTTTVALENIRPFLEEGTMFMQSIGDDRITLGVREEAVAWYTVLGSLGIRDGFAYAETHVQALIDAVPQAPVYRVAQAELLVMQHRLDESLQKLATPMLAEDPEAARVRINIFLAQGRIDDAQRELARFDSLRTSAHGRLVQAAILIHSGDYIEAGRYLDRFMLDFPSIAEGYLYRAVAYRARGDLPGARETLLRGLREARTGDMEALQRELAAVNGTSTISR